MRLLAPAILLAGFAFQVLLSPAHAQAPTGGGGGSTGGGGGSTGGAARGGTGGGTQASSGNFAPTAGIGFGAASPSLQGNTGNVRGGAGTNVIPTQPNPFRSYFGNPLGIGMSGTTTTNAPKAAFGQPLFGAVTSSTAADQAGDSGAGSGFSTIGMRKAPSYVTVLSDDIPLIQHPPADLQRNLKEVLRRSTTLKGKDSIAVTVNDDAIVILRGLVPTDRERRLAESLIRLTPGVVDVQNELTVGP